MKNILLPFLSPCGRIGRRGFWWRQLALMPLAFAGGFAGSLGLLLREKACVFSQLQGDDILGGIGGFITSSTLPNLLAAGWGSVEAENCVGGSLYMRPDFDPAAYAGPLMVLGWVLLLPTAWSVFSLILRRLRDTRLGLWPLPLGLPLLWPALAEELGAGKETQFQVFYAALALAHVLFFLPSRPREAPLPKA